MDIPALPYWSLIDLTVKKPFCSQYPQSLRTIGDHIRKKRLDLKLFQQEVAKQIGITESTLLNWEHNRSTPTVQYIPRVIAFLGYDPFANSPMTLGEQLMKYRQYRGLNQKQLAKQIGIDPTTLSRLERSKERYKQRIVRKVSEFLIAQGR